MKQIRPDYYDHFSCTADQCPITCCQEWKISVDDHTNNCWKKLAPPTDTIPAKTRLSAYTTFKDGTRVIALIQRPDRTPSQALMECFYILRELYHQDNWDAGTLEDYFSEQTLSELHEAVLSAAPALEDTIIEDNEILQDLAVNYQKEGLYQSYLTPVLAQAERLTDAYGTAALSDQWKNFNHVWEEFHPLLKNVLANELFSDLLIPGGNLESMIIQMQWLALEYAAVRQSLFLTWLEHGNEKLPYENVRDYLVIIMRMTGYDENDIYEYLENSFEELVWEWGYFALVVC